MKLYELTDNYRNILALFEDEEVPKDALNEALDNIGGMVEDKLTNMTYLEKELAASEEALEKEIKRLTTRKKAISNNRESLKAYMKNSMLLMGRKRIKTDLFTWNIQNNPPKVILNESIVPEEFKKEVINYTIDKKAILEQLKQGISIEGARLEVGESLRIR